jgi:2-dehydropantoate 2-reductase
LKIYDERRLSRVGRGSADQRPSMGQDMAKGRRTEIEYLNGFVVREGEQAGIQARANERLVDIVKKIERGDLKQDPRHNRVTAELNSARPSKPQNLVDRPSLI